MRKVLKAIWDLNKAPVQTEEEKTAFIWASYIFPFILMPYCIWNSYEFADMINEYYPVGKSTIKYLQIASVAFFAIGTLVRQDDKFVSCTTNPATAELNVKISKTPAIIGIYLTFIAYHLEPLS